MDIFLFFLFLLFGNIIHCKFGEKILIRNLPNALIELEFSYQLSLVESTDEKNLQYDYFPKSIGEILIEEEHVSSFHLSLGYGVWRYNSWGDSVVPLSPPGLRVELWQEKNEANVWERVVKRMAGKLCSSMTELTMGKNYHKLKVNDTYHFNGMLPAEFLCTENVKPLLELLPCNNNWLDDPSFIHFRSDLFFMKVSYDKIGNDIQLIITFHIVLNVLDEMKKNGLFIPFGNLLGN
ncbi:hypothetical protein SNEBB_011060, partial [Seison nebaliae]